MAMVPVLLTACSTMPTAAAPETSVLAVALPAPVAAWACAEACRMAFPAADPLPAHRGAPLRSTADGFLVRYVQFASGHWRCDADARIWPVQTADPTVATSARWEPAPELGRSAGSELRAFACTIRAVAAGRTTVRCQDLAAADPQLANEIERLLALATAEARGALLLREGDPEQVLQHAATTIAAHPLGSIGPRAPLLGRLHLQSAMAYRHRGDHAAELRALQQARATLGELPGLDLWCARVQARSGQDQPATALLAVAALRSDDPAARGLAARAIVELAARAAAPGPRLRAAAATTLQAGDPGTARQLLHRAQQAAPDPPADLLLLQSLQLATGDRRAALESALLLREYLPSADSERLVAQAFHAEGLASFTDRAQQRAQDRHDGNALLAALLRALQQPAPVRWLAATLSGQAAAPPR